MRTLAFAALTLFALSTASARACDGAKADHAHEKAGKDCTKCPKAKSGGCPHATSTTASTAPDTKVGHAECPHARATRAAQPNADDTLTASGKPAPGREMGGRFTGSGRILCAHCDLKRSETCRSMFKASGSNDVYGLCDGDLSEQIRKMTQHGELEVTVHGRLQASESGEDIVCIEGCSVGTI